MLKFPSNITSAEFLRRHWQKQPLFMPAALSDLPLLSADELAWLATQPDVESRLVFTEEANEQIGYRLEHGPFEADYLASLPERNWTLLVQDVEKHLPEFRKIFAELPFISEWRIDDLMISFAAPGGSVGPHVDNYDVFLCQVDGQREWQIASERTTLIEQRDNELALVLPFSEFESYSAGPGDVLYLPPGRGHWGIATSNCLTYSIGMRAPTAGQLAGEIARQASVENGLDQRYADPDLATEEAEPGQISPAALGRAQGLLQNLANMDAAEFATIFGSMVTDPKAWLAPATIEETELGDILDELAKQTTVRVHGMAQLAFAVVEGRLLIFANGFSCEAPAEHLLVVKILCSERAIPSDQLLLLSRQADSNELLHWLLKSGVFEPAADDD